MNSVMMVDARRMCCQLATAVATLPCTHECVRADAISVLMR